MTSKSTSTDTAAASLAGTPYRSYTSRKGNAGHSPNTSLLPDCHYRPWNRAMGLSALDLIGNGTGSRWPREQIEARLEGQAPGWAQAPEFRLNRRILGSHRFFLVTES